MATDEIAREQIAELGREVAGQHARIDALADTVRDHRVESQQAHRETQRMLGEISRELSHLKGAASAAPAQPAATPPPAASALAAVPPSVWAGLGTLLVAAAAAVATAFGWSSPPPPPEPPGP